jgi:hypothetical protein
MESTTSPTLTASLLSRCTDLLSNQMFFPLMHALRLQLSGAGVSPAADFWFEQRIGEA